VQRERWFRTVPSVVAAVGVLALSGCATVVIGRPSAGETAGPRASGDVTVVGAEEGTVDDLAAAALADLEDYWTETLPEVFGQEFVPLAGGYFSVDPDAADPADYPDGVGCGAQPVEVENNAFYCLSSDAPNSDAITYDRAFLAELAEGYGEFIPALVMAHEFGHAIQARVGSPGPSIATETQADCLAGSWTREVAEGDAERSRIRERQLDELLSGYLLLRDPVGTSTAAESAHGSYFDRVSAFQEGFDSGAEACRDNFGPNRPFTQSAFSQDEDLLNKGNLPYGQIRPLVERSLPDFWELVFTEVFRERFDRPTIEAFRGTAPDCAEDDRDLVYCPDEELVGFDETDLALPAYELGDFAVATAMSIPYAEAARDQLGLSATNPEALQSAVCLTGAFGAQVFAGTLPGISASPGDLDEGIQFLLAYGDDPDVLGAAELTGFQLVDLFRNGFFQGPRACGLGA
jgi:predicted metalloprotease